MKLKTIATFRLGETKSGTTTRSVILKIARGSVLDFSSPSNEGGKGSSLPQGRPLRVGAIVNAANERCIGGGGVDGALNDAGGPRLWRDRENLPLLSKDGIRCHTGGAVVTGPGHYGKLRVSYIVHAVGPIYPFYSIKNIEKNNSDKSPASEGTKADDDDDDFSEPDALLQSAYRESLERCRENDVTDVGFSLLSSGIFRGKRSLDDVLAIGVLAIRDWVMEQEEIDATNTNRDNCGEDRAQSSPHCLQNVTLCGFLESEVNALMKVCQVIFDGDNDSEQDQKNEHAVPADVSDDEDNATDRLEQDNINAEETSKDDRVLDSSPENKTKK